ncbi:MAG: hypothetical protein ACRYG8_53470 [Janthinobacterium lividum]
MPVPDLATPATLFEAVDALDDELSGQELQQGSLHDVVETAMTMADCRLGSAKIVAADGTELHAAAIEALYEEEVGE